MEEKSEDEITTKHVNNYFISEHNKRSQNRSSLLDELLCIFFARSVFALHLSQVCSSAFPFVSVPFIPASMETVDPLIC